MKKEFERFAIIVGENNINILKEKHVAVFGIGGVGSFASEALVRSGIGRITLIDYDDVDITNINRQLLALHSTIGNKKTDVLKERFLDINPSLEVETFTTVFSEESSDKIIKDYDYIVDAIDMVKSKIFLIRKAYEKNIPIISSMGMGFKLNPLDIKVCSIKKTHTCPLARVMRRELKKYDIDDVKCVFSTENPKISEKKENENGKVITGSSAFVPSVAGLIIASEIIKDLIDLNCD